MVWQLVFLSQKREETRVGDHLFLALCIELRRKEAFQSRRRDQLRRHCIICFSWLHHSCFHAATAHANELVSSYQFTTLAFVRVQELVENAAELYFRFHFSTNVHVVFGPVDNVLLAVDSDHVTRLERYAARRRHCLAT